MGENQAEDFMGISKHNERDCMIARRAGFLLLVLVCACNRDLSDDPIPEGFFPDITINLNLPAYIQLKNDGGFVNIDGGVRGIILHRKNSITYLAYERNCSFHPNDACATVEVHSSNLFMIDTCCGSSFSLDDGVPTGGPAWRPLRKYRTYLNGTELVITSESVNGM